MTESEDQRGPGRALVRAGRSFVEERFIRPAAAFVQTQASGGIILLAAAMVALAWANSPWEASYFDLWETQLSINAGLFSIEEDLGHAVNDGLMAIFFFVVGLEIKRELLHGELASFRKAALPVAGALGGMVVPALIYLAWNPSGDASKGWGIPMATDIAFAMGVLALLGRRVPFALKVFLLALAIVDDLGAIVVIAIFYTESISLEGVVWAVILAGVIYGFGRAGVRSVDVYVLLGVLFWVAVFKSGIHATIAGVVLAMLTPSRPLYDPAAFEASAEGLRVSYREARLRADRDAAQGVLRQFESLSKGTESPLERLEHTLHPWVSYLIVPVFALANAGVALSADGIREAAGSGLTLGVVTGLVIGKPAGILIFSWVAVRSGLATLPASVGFVHLLGAGLIAGIGFTVSLFIAGLAFTDPGLIDEGKIGILAASALAGIVGFAYLWLAPGEPGREEQ